MARRKVEMPDLAEGDDALIDSVIAERVAQAGAWPALTDAQAGQRAWARLRAAVRSGGLPQEHRVRRNYVKRAAQLAGESGRAGSVIRSGIVVDKDLKG